MTEPMPPSFWIDRSDRPSLRLRGPDRVKFLHNLCTNDIKGLRPGRGCEAFVTNLQGKTLGFVSVLAGESELLLRTEPGGLAAVLPHFAKYGVFDDVTWEEPEEGSTFEIHVAGAASLSTLSTLSLEEPGPEELSHTEGKLRVIREFPYGLAGVTILGPANHRGEITEALRNVVVLSEENAERLRIEAGTPHFGRDITTENLPQEIGRDARAINFVKGCYLGQETVARLDALGHVNKILKGLKIAAGPVPTAGTALASGEDRAGHVSSSASSASGEGGVALAMVRVKYAKAGTELSWNGSAAIVVDLPGFAMAGEPPKA